MKILFLSHSFPWPLQEGVRLHVYHLIKELSTRHEIHLCSFIEEEKERESIAHLSPYCRSVTVVNHTVPRQPWRRLWNILFQSDPFSIYQFQSSSMASMLKAIVSRVQPDVLHVDFSVMAPYAILFPGLANVFFPHDAMSMLFERNVRHEPTLLRKFYMAAQARKMARFEARMLPLFAQTVVVSPVDKAVLQARAPQAQMEWIPNGVDSHYFSPQAGAVEKPIVLFRGIMSFLPNADAALFAAKEIMPRVWNKRPDARFCIIGANPLPDLNRLAENERRVQLLGFVEDLRTPTAEAAVILCPMRIGSGIKNKILESMAMEKAIVATPMSLAGIDAEPGVHLLTAETADRLADHVVHLLNSAEDRRKLGQAAGDFVRRHHSWKRHAERFSEVYDKAFHMKKGESNVP